MNTERRAQRAERRWQMADGGWQMAEPPNRIAWRFLTSALCLLSSALFVACGFFSRSQPKFYSLDRLPPSTPVASISGTPIAIDSIELPPGFDRRDIVVRKANQELEVRGANQWSASLEPLVLHTLAFDLASRLPTGFVILPGAAKPLSPTRSIDVVFEELAAGPDAKVVLDARWSLRTASVPGVTTHERIEIPIDSLDSASIASGISRALAALADRMASGVVRASGAP